MKRSRLGKSIWAVTLAVLVPAALALVACGSDTAPTDLPTRTTPVPAVSFPPQDYRAGHKRMGNDAFAFVPWVDIEVTGLGYYDHDGDGLVTEHMVGIFEESSKELVTPPIIVDSESELTGSVRYESVAPVVLKAGTHYIVAGQTEPPYGPDSRESERPRLGARDRVSRVPHAHRRVRVSVRDQLPLHHRELPVPHARGRFAITCTVGRDVGGSRQRPATREGGRPLLPHQAAPPATSGRSEAASPVRRTNPYAERIPSGASATLQARRGRTQGRSTRSRVTMA